MAEIANLTAEPRTTRGSRAAHHLRKAGRIPGVVYGHKEDAVSISVSGEELNRAIRVLHARTFNLSVGGQTQTVLIKELQWDHLGSEMIHVDFERHDLSERVKVTVPVELRNTPKATGGGVLDQPLHKLHVECPLGSIPDSIRIDIVGLTLGNPIHVRELTLPEGVTVLEPAEAVIVQLKLPGAEPTPGTTLDVEATGPEVIKKEKKTDDEDEK